MKWLVTVLFLSCLAPAQATETLHIDESHSRASFSVRLFWISHVEGRMDRLRGALRIDDAETVRVDVRVDVADARMDNPRREAMLRSEDFFNTARYPFIHFQSSPFAVSLLWRGGTIHGELTMRGTTRPAQFSLQPAQCNRDSLTQCVIRASGKVQRKDFGMSAYRLALGNEVQLKLKIGLQQ